MYSNVTPPALPEWDTSAYPYYVLVFTYGKGDTDWFGCALYYMAAPFVYNDGGYVTGTAETFGYRGYKTSTETWEYWLNGEEFQQPGTALELIPGIVGGNYQRIYTSHDILDASGNVWLAAGSVTEAVETVTEKWLRSFQIGLALGLAGKPLPIKKEPVAYLYNGVRLPKLPEWDKETYPYAFMYKNSGSTSTYLVVSDSIGYYGKLLPLGYGFTIGNNKRWCLDGALWSIATELESGNFGVTAGTGASNNIVWTNTDIYYEDGTLYFAASEPVPVYE